jgi:6-pyruvoyltetrahydropterin/6-carboxytetrahydropterin synthase
MSSARLTRKVRFAAAHRYARPDWSEAENRRVFGACANAHGHGHNYLLEATVRGRVDASTGFSVDLDRLDDALRSEVLEVFDHRHINHDVPGFEPGGLIPTCENILVWLWPRLSARLPAGAVLERLRLHEDETLYVDYFGPDA